MYRKGKTKIRALFPWRFLDCVSRSIAILDISNSVFKKKLLEKFNYFLRHWLKRNEGVMKP